MPPHTVRMPMDAVRGCFFNAYASMICSQVLCTSTSNASS